MSRRATAIGITRTSIIGTFTEIACGLALASLAAAVQAAPYVPKDDATVLERLPVRPGDPVARELRQLRAELARDPQNLGTALRLAERYYELAGAEGDPRYIGYAQAGLRPWWELRDKFLPAKWKGIAFYGDPKGNGLPCMGIVYENIEAGKQIFSDWHERIGRVDEFEELRNLVAANKGTQLEGVF